MAAPAVERKKMRRFMGAKILAYCWHLRMLRALVARRTANFALATPQPDSLSTASLVADRQSGGFAG
jgi:hypothetical protein